jgi:hypothetical protein
MRNNLLLTNSKRISMKLYRSIKTGLAVVAAAASVGFAGIAIADPIDFLPADTDFKFKYSNLEVQITQSGQELFGVFNINLITNELGSVTYWTGNGVSDGTQLVGFFSDLIATVSQTGQITFTGGYLSIYNVANTSYNPAAFPNVDPDTLTAAQLGAELCGGLCPTPWATFNFATGILDPNNTVTLAAALAPTFPATATGNGYLSVGTTPAGTGTNNAFFDTNGLNFFTNNPPADAFLRSDFSLCGPPNPIGCAGWQVTSEDPVTVRTIAVPEPGSLALLSLGVLGLAAVRSRRRS